MSLPVQSQKRGAILKITLDRPKANAIDCATSQRLYDIFHDFQQDDALQVAVLTSAGERFFSAGWDLNAAAAGEAVDADHGPGGFAGLTEYFSLDKPVIAAVNGMAVGGGFELALACDMIIAVEHAEFFLPEAQIGIVADSGGVFRLPQRIPKPIALELLLTGKRLSAQKAQHYGLVNAVTTQANLLPTALAMAKKITTAAPLAQRAIKELVQVGESLSTAKAFELQRSGNLKAYQRMLLSVDSKEGSLAFSEGREPVWIGQ